MQIRTYTDSDIDSLLNLLRLNTPEYFAREEEQDFIKYLSEKLDLYFVAEENGAIIGCGGINRYDDGKTAFISWDIIHPAHQGKGVGAKLTKYRIDVIKKREDVDKIIVRTSQHAFKFYEKMGFTLIEIIKDYWAQGFDMYYMQIAF